MVINLNCAAILKKFNCHKDIKEKLFIKTYNMAPVAMVFPNNAKASFPFERFSAIIPEPTTTETRKKVPRNSTKIFLFIFKIKKAIRTMAFFQTICSKLL